MPRLKRNSTTLSRAERRMESLKSLKIPLDFGNGLTLPAYNSLIDEVRSQLADYNTALSGIDKMADDISTAEQALLKMSEQMLLGVASRYGRASQEYEMAGGTRRRSSRRPKAALPTPAASSAPAIAASNGAAVNGSAVATDV